MFARTEMASPATIERRLPCLSDSCPHGRLTRNCARGNEATSKPENSEMRAAVASAASGVLSSSVVVEIGGRIERTR